MGATANVPGTHLVSAHEQVGEKKLGRRTFCLCLYIASWHCSMSPCEIEQ